MSELEKLFEAIGRRPLTIYHHTASWYAELQIREYPIQGEGDTLAAAIHSALCKVLDHASEKGRALEDEARKARDEVDRLRALLQRHPDEA